MYKILKKYIKEYFSFTYTEDNNGFSFYLYYPNIRTHVKHRIYADKNSFYCWAELICGDLYEDYEDYIVLSYDPPIYTLAKINNDLSNGYIELDEKTGALTLFVEFKPNISFSEYTEHYYLENLNKMIFYGRDTLDKEFGDLLYRTFVEFQFD